MAPRRRTQTKRPIESYDHRDKERLNNPPVGLVTPDTDKDAGKKTYGLRSTLGPATAMGGRPPSAQPKGRDRRGTDRGLPGHCFPAL